MGAEMYLFCRFDNREIMNTGENLVVHAFNERHAARRVQIDWGIGGIKKRIRPFLTKCPNRRHHFKVMFEACARFTNYIHRRRMKSCTREHGDIEVGERSDALASTWAGERV